MAENVVLGIDVQDNSERALKTFSDNMRAANKEVAVASESFRKAGQGAKNFGDAVRAPGRAIGEFGKGLSETAKGVEEFTQTMAELPKTVIVAKENLQEMAVSLAGLGLSFAKHLSLIHI